MGTRRRRVSVIYFISKPVKWDDLRMEIITNPKQDEIKKAAQALKDGHLVAFPTETVYGLGADAINEKAVGRIYSVKGRPTDHPLIVHISTVEKINKWAIDIPTSAIDLANSFWPGPMTLILKRTGLAKNFITGGQNKIGIRIPSHPIALNLLSEFEKIGGIGLAAPSANRFGAVSPTTSSSVLNELKNYLNVQDIILDGGQCDLGIESTIIDCTGPIMKILRPGFITSSMVRQVTSQKIMIYSEKTKLNVSGSFESHYSPKAKVIIKGPITSGAGFIAMNFIETPPETFRLASPNTLEQYAKELYSAFRQADQQGLKEIIVIPPTGNELAFAINDRIIKASK